MYNNIISRVAAIELYNLKNIVPFVYKNGNNFIEIKHTFSVCKDSTVSINNNNKIPLSNIYFKNGYQTYVSFDSYLKTKYSIEGDMKNNNDKAKQIMNDNIHI